MSNTFMPFVSTLNHVSPIDANNDKRRWSWDRGGLDSELSTCLTTNYKKRINSRQSRIFTTSVMGLCHAICYLFKKLKLFFASIEFQKDQNNSPVLLFKTLFWHWYCFPSSVAMDCKDWKWTETWANNKIQDTYSNFNQTSTWLIQIMKVTKKVTLKWVYGRTCMTIITGASGSMKLLS